MMRKDAPGSPGLGGGTFGASTSSAPFVIDLPRENTTWCTTAKGAAGSTSMPSGPSWRGPWPTGATSYGPPDAEAVQHPAAAPAP